MAKRFKHTSQDEATRAELAKVSAADIEGARLLVEGMQGDAEVKEGQVVRRATVKYLDGNAVKRAPAKYLRGFWAGE